METSYISRVLKSTKLNDTHTTAINIIGYLPSYEEADRARLLYEEKACETKDMSHFYRVIEIPYFKDMTDYLKNFNSCENYKYALVEETRTTHAEPVQFSKEETLCILPDMNNADAVKHIVDKHYIFSNNVYIKIKTEQMNIYENADTMVKLNESLNEYEM